MNPPPIPTPSWLARLREALWANRTSQLTTLTLLALLVVGLPPLFDWAVLRAQWLPQAEACRAPGAGACWGVIAEKYALILLGRYPPAELWRAVLACTVLLALLVASAQRRCWRPALGLAWVLGLGLFTGLMLGGLAGLPRVTTDLWGGLPLTLLLSSVSMALAFPLAVAVALGRRSSWPAVRVLCSTYVELVRGVPLISVLFMASFLIPLFMPQGLGVDVLLRVLVGITLFAAAYMAEVVRGGLQSVAPGQAQAAAALGLSWWQVQRHVVLPQALTAVLPGLVNNFIGLFKDTSLVTVVSLYELTGALSLALNADADWRAYKLEGYLFIALIYFVFCFAISRHSQRLERQLQAPT